MSAPASESPDVVLIGAGIMSATLGTVLKELEPGARCGDVRDAGGLRTGEF